MREILLRFTVDWKDYDDVHPQLVLEDSGILEQLKDGVRIEVVSGNRFHQVGRDWER